MMPMEDTSDIPIGRCRREISANHASPNIACFFPGYGVLYCNLCRMFLMDWIDLSSRQYGIIYIRSQCYGGGCSWLFLLKPNKSDMKFTDAVGAISRQIWHIWVVSSTSIQKEPDVIIFDAHKAILSEYKTLMAFTGIRRGSKQFFICGCFQEGSTS